MLRSALQMVLKPMNMQNLHQQTPALLLEVLQPFAASYADCKVLQSLLQPGAHGSYPCTCCQWDISMSSHGYVLWISRRTWKN